MSTKKITASHKGRKCRYKGCKRALSIYNHEVHCHVHLVKLSGMMQLQSAERV